VSRKKQYGMDYGVFDGIEMSGGDFGVARITRHLPEGMRIEANNISPLSSKAIDRKQIMETANHQASSISKVFSSSFRHSQIGYVDLRHHFTLLQYRSRAQMPPPSVYLVSHDPCSLCPRNAASEKD